MLKFSVRLAGSGFLALAFGLLAVVITAVTPVAAESVPPLEDTDEENSEESSRLTAYETCLIRLTQSASNTLSAGNVRNYCAREARQQGESAQSSDTPLEQRREMERLVLNNPFSLLPHRPNYLMPMNYSKFHDDSAQVPGNGEFQPFEIQFQLSLKVIAIDGLIGDHGDLAFAYTGKSFWQAYNFDLSSPFRETNHEPELILTFANDFDFLGFTNVSNAVSLNHESNGRSGEDSRSWNRVIFQTQWERDRLHPGCAYRRRSHALKTIRWPTTTRTFSNTWVTSISPLPGLASTTPSGYWRVITSIWMKIVALLKRVGPFPSPITFVAGCITSMATARA